MVRITFQLPGQQHNELVKYAKKSKKSISEYIRLRLFDSETVESKISIYAIVQSTQTEVDNLKSQLEIIGIHLVENEKKLSGILNMLYQFMRQDIGPEKAKEIGATVQKIMTEEDKNGK